MLLFVSQDELKQWDPVTYQIETLAENVAEAVYGGDLAILSQENPSTGSYTLSAFHFLTRIKTKIIDPPKNPHAISLSPNGQWLAYVTRESEQMPSLIVRKIQTNAAGIIGSESILALNLSSDWAWPFDTLSWAADDFVSWSDREGIWLADLTAIPVSPFVAIEPSRNTYQFPALNPTASGSSSSANTKYIPLRWSPNGRFLIVIEYYFEDGVFRVIDRHTGLSAEVPNSYYGVFTEDAIWLDNNNLLHLSTAAKANIWHVNPEAEPFLELTNTIPLDSIAPSSSYDFLRLVNHNVAHFVASSRQSNEYNLFKLDLTTCQLTQSSQNPNADYGWPSVTWSHEGNYALLLFQVYDPTWVHRVFFDELNGEQPTDLGDSLGTEPWYFYWYKQMN